MRILTKALAAAVVFTFTSGTCFALTPLTPLASYSITSSKLTSSGTVTDIETVPAQTDANGKLTFSLTTLPTNADVNFLAFTIKDANGVVVRQGVVPAPPNGDINQIGINDLATAQAATFLKAAQLAGSDDPILASYLLVLLRSPNILASDVDKLGNLGKAAILNGFEVYLAGKVSAGKVTALKNCLIYNPDATKKTLRDIAKGFYAALESANASTESTETQKAGALMADVFMDASACAGVELDLITNAHNAAGDAAQATGLLGGGVAPISANLQSSIDQSMSTFNRKIGMVKMVTKYAGALTTLQASGTQVDTFIAAAQAMALANNAVENQYGDYFKDPSAYLAAHPGTDQTTVQNAINTIFQNAWSAFQNAIAASDADILALKTLVQSAFPGIQLPPDFGLSFVNGTTTNWPVQQVVMVKWMVNLILNGGSIGYTRDSIAIPTNMQMWVGTCSNTMYWDKMSCQGHGGTWTSQRSVFTTPSAAFNAYLGIQQDVSIADMTRNTIWDNGNQPTQTERTQAAEAFLANLASITGNITATKTGGVSASDAEKKAIITLMLQPQND